MLFLASTCAGVVASGFTGKVVPSTVLSQSVVFADALRVTDDSLHAQTPIAAGEKLVEWNEGSCLTAEAAFADMDVGRHLRAIAPRVGPGFETVALATLLAGEYVRGFKTRPTAIMPEGGDQAAFENLVPSQWSELTRPLWEDARGQDEQPVDQELAPLVEQAVQMMMPSLDFTARAAWSCGLQARSKGEVLWAAETALLLVMRHQQFPPSASGLWGSHDGAPKGPALLPLHGLAAAGGTENVELRCPPDGSQGSDNVCLQCVASRDIPEGELLTLAG